MARDNIQIKDALSDEFTLRAKDVSSLGDGSVQKSMVLATPYPMDYAPGGIYHLTSKSGVMVAGLAANAPIYSFRNPSATLLMSLKRLRISAWSAATGFAAGIAIFDIYRALAFTVADTGGVTDTLTGDNGNLRSSMPTSALSELRHSSTATLTAGTRTLDAQPVDTMIATIGTTALTVFASRVSVFEAVNGDHPLVLAQNEGFILQATVPATGTWSWAITSEWDELPLY
jgi:hypothetical protein